LIAKSALAAALERKPLPVGGFSPAILRLEVRRLLRNRRTMTLALVVPAVEMISIALYGAVAATTTCPRPIYPLARTTARTRPQGTS